MFVIISLWQIIMSQGRGPYLPHGAWLFHVSRIIAYGRYSRPGAWPICAPGAWLAGFIKGATRHCYTQNIKELGYMVSETEEDFFMFFPLSVYGSNGPPRTGPFLIPGT